MMQQGGCHCGAVRYTVEGDPLHSALCHCSDCRKASGAPMVGWIMVPKESVTVTGEPTRYVSSEHAVRTFCGTCGSGLFYINEVVLPGMVDIQLATLDDPGAFPPAAHIQWADTASWMQDVQHLPKFDRFPDQDD